MRGRKTGGRQTGTPNRSTSLVERLLEKMEADPLGHMAKVMMDEDAHPRLRGPHQTTPSGLRGHLPDNIPKGFP